MSATMPTVVDLLARVHEHGAELVPEPSSHRIRILYRDQYPVPDDLMAELVQNKPALLAYLRTCCFYRFRLRGGAGSIYRTETRDLDAARAELAKVYGDLMIVAAHERREV